MDVIPRDPRVVPVRFDGKLRFVIWGLHENDDNCLLAIDDRIRSYETVLECLAFELKSHRKVHYLEDEPILDFDGVLGWIKRKAGLPDFNAALELWNFALDVANTIDVTPTLLGRRRSVTLYAKLFAANVAWAAPEELVGEPWTGAELEALHALLLQAGQLVRTSIPLAG